MKRFLSFAVVCIFVWAAMAGCASSKPQMTTSIAKTTDVLDPPDVPVIEEPIVGYSSQELLSLLADHTEPMGGADMLRKILCNENLEALQNGIHKAEFVDYSGWADWCGEDSENSPERIDLYFHPSGMCSKQGEDPCDHSDSDGKLRVSVHYDPSVCTPGDFPLKGCEKTSENPLTFRGTTSDGTVTYYYYFLNEHYVVYLSVDTEYMEANDQVVAQFTKFCLSMGQDTEPQSE